MKTKSIAGFVLVVILVGTMLPFVSFAQTNTPTLPINPALRTVGPDGGLGSGDPNNSGAFQFVPCTGVLNKDGTGKECTFEDLLLMARRIIQFVLYIITPIVVGMIVYTGFKYMTAGGDVKLVADAKRMFTPILLGVFFIFAAWLIVYTVLDRLLANQIGDIPKSNIVPAGIR